MKKLFTYLLVAITMIIAGCSEPFDDSAIWDKLDDHESRITKLEELCQQMNTNISSLKTIVEALQNNDYVTSVTPVTKDGETIGYTITFAKAQSITIYHGKDGVDGEDGADGKDGTDGYTPIIGVAQDSDGIYYWTLDGEWLLDDAGNKIKAVGIDGKDGQDGEDGKDGQDGADGTDGVDGENGADGADGSDGEDGKNGENGADGKDGITPKLKIENDYWHISYDNGATWTQLGKATGEDGKDGANGSDGADGKDGDSFFEGVDTSNDDYVVFTLADGTIIKIPTWYAFEQLKKQCEEMNQNITAMQQILEALQNNDYVTSVQQIVEDGKTIGYTIYFSKSGAVTIYHGENGKDGADGIDGVNGADGKDGHSPIVGVRQDSDGIYYWTLDGEWLLDDAGNKIKAVGIDGKDGQDGEDGKDGQDGADGTDGVDGENGADGKDGVDGITPQLKIENEYWYISYDNGTTWTQLGKATGEDGKDGIDGVDGDSFFQDVTQDDNNVYFTLADGTVITVPKGLALSITFDEADLVVMSPNSTRQIGYTVTSATESVKVEVTSSADIKAKVVADNENGLTGKIHIATSATIDEYSKVIVFVSNGDKVIMRSITFEEAGLQVEENATKFATAEGGEMTLEFLSNVACEVVIPEEAQSWISVVPATRAMEKRTITLKLEPNEGYYRSATLIVQSHNGSLRLEYQVEQDGELGIQIDPKQIPDNEIWYRTTDNKKLEVSNSNLSDSKFIDNIYASGFGKLVFSGPITKIVDDAFSACSNVKEIIIPSKVSVLKARAFRHCKNLQSVTIMGALSIVEPLAFWDCPKLDRFISTNAIEDGNFLVINDEIKAVAGYNLHEVDIPNTIISIGDTAFKGCSDIESVNIPSSVKIIGNSAFDNCINLQTLVLSEGLLSIGSGNSSYSLGDSFAFTNIEEVVFPQSLEFVDAWSFRGCENIKGFYGNNKFHSSDNKCLYAYLTCGEPLDIPYIGKYVGNDVSYTIPNGIWAIETHAFEDLPMLEEVIFPSTLTQISPTAFYDCPNIKRIKGPMVSEDGLGVVLNNTYVAYIVQNRETSVKVQDGVTTIGQYAFAHTWDFGAEASKNHESRCILEEISMSDSVETIEDYAFAYCRSLKKITLSANLQSIASMKIISSSEDIDTVYLRAKIPPHLIDAQMPEEFRNNPDIIIFVPEQSMTLYQNSSDWASYREYIKGYKYTDLPENDTYISSDYSKDGTITTLQTATKGDGIDIVLMGDAYSDRQIADGTYKADMENLYNNLFTEEPYKSFKDHFNVYYVNVVSATEGYEYSGAALGGYFGSGTLVGGNDNAVFNYALNAISEEEMDEALLIVAMNSDNYAGTCYMYYPTYTTGTYGSGLSVAYFPKGGDAETFAQLLHHEACGHGFAKLADEYAYEEFGAIPSDYASQIQEQQSSWGWWKNVDFTSDPTATRWSHFINDTRYANEGLGAYEGGLTYWSGIWRPTENSIMRYNTGGFNAPSREAIYYRIHKLAYGDSWQYDYEEFVEWDARNRKSEALAARKAVKPANYKPTHAPIIVNKSWKDAK